MKYNPMVGKTKADMKVLFAERIKQLRIEKGLTQTVVAKNMDVAPNTVSQWESGLIEPDFATLVMLAKFFGETTDFLLGVKDF